MSIKNLQRLSMNSHFYGLLLQGFLSGYDKPCEVRLLFMALPILLYSESRKKLSSANSKSHMVSLFDTPDSLENNVKISGKVKLAGYLKRFDELKPFSKKILIILNSEEKITFNKTKIILLKAIDYKNFDNTIKDWAKAAHYLGIVFAKSNEEHLNYFLGVDRK